MGDRSETARWRIPWYGWLALLIAMLAVALVPWLRSERDLIAVDTRARALGIQPTWAELGLRLSPESALASWRRLKQLAGAVRSYQDTAEWILRIGSPLPPELAKHHERLNPGEMEELLALCSHLPSGLITHTSASYDSDLPELTWRRELCRLFVERVSLAEPGAVAGEARRLLGIGTAQRPISLIHELVCISCVSMWQRAVATRMHDDGIDRAALAEQADEARAWLKDALAAGLDSEVRNWRDIFARVQAGDPKVTVELEHAMLPRWLQGFGVGPIWMRAGRGAAMSLLVDQAWAWRSTSDFAARAAALKVIEAHIGNLPAWLPEYHLMQFMSPSATMIHESWIKGDTGLAVIAAELRRTSWPIDPTDPMAGTVRRIERNGRLIGYYLLGRNGLDDGGRANNSTGDFCLPLYERLGSPLAADPLKSDP